MNKEELHIKLNNILEEIETGNVSSAKLELIKLISEVSFM
jgi:hypothetical protein|tara:strand:- start:1033 stop:1152 length:120 start_codon:yes stop_codon:yes gene_type:complete